MFTGRPFVGSPSLKVTLEGGKLSRVGRNPLRDAGKSAVQNFSTFMCKSSVLTRRHTTSQCRTCAAETGAYLLCHGIRARQPTKTCK